MFYIDTIINCTKETPISWLQIENKLLSPRNYLSILFSNQKRNIPNFIIKSTCTTWERIQKQLGQNIQIPRHITIWNNPSIKIQNTTVNWEVWKLAGIHTLGDIVDHHSMLSYKDLKEKFKIPDTEFFRFLQIKNWIKKNLDLTFGAPSVLGKVLEKKGKKQKTDWSNL